MKYLIFDLDGTLTDSSKGIINSIHYALDQLNVPKPSFRDTQKFIGPPLIDTFEKLLPKSIKPEHAVKYYREYYADKGIFENSLYKGIKELLEAKKRLNVPVALGTAKPTYFARIILRHFDIYDAFDVIVGSHLNGGRTDKKEIIYEVKDQWGWQNPNHVAMIGDRSTDMLGAIHHNLPTFACKYGYAQPNELEALNPFEVVNNCNELKEKLHSWINKL
jgi:phosphoglycolate phosphatase